MAGTYEFKFINGNSWSDLIEEVPMECSEQTSEHFNRQLTITAEMSAEVDVCFSACVPCHGIPPCKLFRCPGWMVHRMDQLETVATTSAECCEASPPYVKDVVVQSAGFDDGNQVSFWLKGTLIYATTRRGLTAMVLSSDGELNRATTFDTNQDSSQLEIFLEALENGTQLLLGASDEASSSLSPRARELIRGFGGTAIDQIAWRGSYALIGVKNGDAFAEAVVSRFGGPAVAVAAVPWAELPLLPLPSCDVQVPFPPSSGKVHSTGNLEVYTEDASCRYTVFERDSISTCLDGAWVVVLGTSNAQLLANNLLFTLAGRNASDHIHFGEFNFHDFVIEDGVVIYHNVIRVDDVEECKQNTTGSNEQEEQCKDTYGTELAKAPAPKAGRVRVTMTIVFFWERVRSMMHIVEADAGWREVKVGYVTQVVAWYLVCQNIKSYLCPRRELKDDTEDQTFQKFTDEMDSVLSYMQTSCSPSGRAGQGFGCVVGTNSYTDAQGSLGEAFRRFNAQVLVSMSSKATGTFRALDVFALGAAMPRETLAGHGSPMVHLWTWMAILGAWCAPQLAADEWQVHFVGPLCSAREVNEALCPRAQIGVEWICMNSEPCFMEIASATQTTTPLSFPVTLRLGMTDQVASGVYVAGSFQGWDPAATPLAESENGYEVTLHLSPGLYEYKFVTGASWDGAEQVPAECAREEFSNRFFEVVNAPLAIETCFGSCSCEVETTATTTSSTGDVFLPVDGGIGRACRGASRSDNLANYYSVVSVSSLDACQSECLSMASCVGVEYSPSRCEVWTRPEGIQASIALSGFSCFKLSTVTSSPVPESFYGVDGGVGRACRGAAPGDNLASYYYIQQSSGLAGCQQSCVQEPQCVGIEYSLGRCEIWTRAQGIEATVALSGFTCQRYSSSARRLQTDFLAV
ncbi:unnamed protein product [Effrenium voratum]|uniref:Apple domain-containing protein n=1 Tax=Effrenium voratum TaxID=2562239 RepID=A0AA36J884_9DINO|nr:unnamed protein product [Effrenium voratum]